MCRASVESYTRRLVFRRRLPPEFGNTWLYVSPSAGLKYLFKSMDTIDPVLLRCAYQAVNPGDVVWDIGANIGLFSFAASARSGATGQVIAFEPDLWLAQILRRSAMIQPQTNASVKVVPIAIASKPSLRNFWIARRSRAANALLGYGSSQMGGIAEEQTVPAFNLDHLLSELPPPNVLKVDVEGAEVEVLRGQRHMLDEVRPIVLCEVSGNNVDEVTRILKASKYALHKGDQMWIGASKVNRAVWNTVAIPEEAEHKILREFSND